MNPNTSKKLLTVLVVLLLLANVTSLALFWFKKENKPMPQNGGPAKFIIKELDFDKKQQDQYLALVKTHQKEAGEIREKIKAAKDNFFNLLSKPNVTELEKQMAAKKNSAYLEELDVVTFNHFAKVRAICTQMQQQKFDEIIKQVIRMMGENHPNDKMPHHGPPMDGPPPHGPDGELPPPPQN